MLMKTELKKTRAKTTSSKTGSASAQYLSEEIDTLKRMAGWRDGKRKIFADAKAQTCPCPCELPSLVRPNATKTRKADFPLQTAFSEKASPSDARSPRASRLLAVPRNAPVREVADSNTVELLGGGKGPAAVREEGRKRRQPANESVDFSRGGVSHCLVRGSDNGETKKKKTRGLRLRRPKQDSSGVSKRWDLGEHTGVGATATE
ncbi:hypothetical protein cyc_07732 [Cyclospora cayetanensis]|uniref:Uncharacterized protein n=1 Tax=Cyclospora cayetanensis TaxID=88456 RepID=A0A1D3CQT9_9EIME|nr:hypothetical protein cyc_07732 [Cyclospora cayetanensis]